MKCLLKFCVAHAVGLAVLFPSSSELSAKTVVLTAVQDTYIQNDEANATHNGLGLLQSATSTGRTASMMMFNLNDPELAGQTITGAFLRVFQLDDTGNDAAFTNIATFFDYPDGSPGLRETMATWNNNAELGAGSEIAAESLGVFSIPVGSLAGATFDSATAGDGDRVYLNERLAKSDADDRYVVIQLFRADSGSGSRKFGDKESIYSGDGLAHPAQLVLTTVPEPSAVLLTLFGFGFVGYAIRRKTRS